MELGTSLIGLLFLLICIGIFFMMSLNSKKKEKQLLTPLHKLAAQYNCSITQHNIWSNAVLGIDETANMIFAVSSIAGTPGTLSISLSELKECRIIRTHRKVIIKDENVPILAKIEIAFTKHDRSKPVIILELYNENTSGSGFHGEMPLIENWCASVNKSCAAWASKNRPGL